MIRAPAPQPDRRWDLLLICIAVFILTSVGRLHQVFPQLLPLKPTLVAGALALVLYALDAGPSRRLHTIASRTTLWGAALLLWAVLSIPGSLWPGGSFGVVFGDFVKTFAMYCVMVGATRGVRDVERLSFVYFAGAAMFAAVALAQFGGGERLDHFPYYDANDFGVFAVTALPLGIYFLAGQFRLSLRVLAAAGIAVLLIAFVQASSRGGFLALLAVIAFVLLRQTTIPLRWRVSGGAVMAALFLAAASDSYWDRMRTMLDASEDYNVTSQTGRWPTWKRGIGYMLDDPLFGVGAGSFGTAEGRLSGVNKWGTAHNAYVQVGAELGIPGLAFLLAFIGATVAALRRATRATLADAASAGSPRLAQTLMASVIGYVVGASFLSLAYAGMFWTLAALAMGLAKATHTARQPRRVRAPPWWPRPAPTAQ